MEQFIGKHPRIEAVDALRGFAVMAIMLLHNIEHFNFYDFPTASSAFMEAMDKGIWETLFFLFSGKAYAIFSLLFGFSFFIQYNNQAKKGKDFRLRFLWRLFLLFIIGCFNGAFFPGDILVLYSIIGVVLVLVCRWSDRAILIAAIILMLPVEWYHCIAGLLNPAHRLPDLGVGEMYARVAEYTKAGNFGDFILGNVTLGQKASLLWAVNAGRFVQTAGLFLLGFYIGRKQLFVATEKNLRFWVKTLIVSAIAFAPLYTLRELVMDNGAVVGQTAGTALDMWQKLAFTLVLVASFILLYQRRKFSAAVAGLRFYGRMSLTNYISQSVIGAFVYFPFGLYLAPRCGYTASLLVGILVFLLQVRFCKWWLGRYKQGPLEYIWHKWTWIGTDK